MSVLIETSIGDIVIDLFVKQRPRCCLNFLKLCKLKYYNFSLFHAIEQNYIAQTGDPTATGTGGESLFRQLYGEQARYFEMEVVPKLRHTRRGIVSMVNNGNDMHGSQFFITLADALDYLDDKHTIFGQVTEGFDTLDKLNQAICDQHNRPYQDIRISHTIILDDPFEDPPNLRLPSRSPSPTLELISSSRIGIDEAIEDDSGKTQEEIQKEIVRKDTQARAQILEMIGDLHHADERPPDNVLFVCKLNPVTTDQDLEIIFSRFGPIKTCEVIKDKRTNASLQYAFIEFEKPEHCESAYFKMDNVLIDDRRIHVDFSQSVAKNYQWNKQAEEPSVPRADRRRHRSPPPRPEQRRRSKVNEEVERRQQHRRPSPSVDDDHRRRRHHISPDNHDRKRSRSDRSPPRRDHHHRYSKH